MIASILICLCALIHFYFAYLEMAAWEAPRTRKIFGQTAESAASSTKLAANQGLYNAVVAGALLLSLFLGVTGMLFYLLAGIVAFGIYAYLTVTKKALYAQAAPAGLAILALLLGI